MTTSLVVPLSAIGLPAVGELVLFATTPGAFVDLAADLARAAVTELVTFEIDTHLNSPVALSVGVDGFSMIHQAIGMLMSGGCPPEQARARIAHLAANDGHDLATVAMRIIHAGGW